MVRHNKVFGNRGQGFSLVELLIAITLLAILAAIGIPTFRQIIAQNRLATATNELVLALKITRAEAIKSNYRAILCASADQITCSGNWHDGWVIFTDHRGLAQPNTILHAHNAFPKEVTIIGNGKIKENIAFNPNGGLGAVSGLLQNGTFTLSVDGGQSLQVVVSSGGRARIVKPLLP